MYNIIDNLFLFVFLFLFPILLHIEVKSNYNSNLPSVHLNPRIEIKGNSTGNKISIPIPHPRIPNTPQM